MTLKEIIKKGLELGLEAVEVYASTSESNTIKLKTIVKTIFLVFVKTIFIFLKK